MKNILPILLLLFVFINVNAQETNKEKASKALSYILHKEYGPLEEMYDTSLTKSFRKSGIKMQEVWPKLESQIGIFEKSHEPMMEKAGNIEMWSIRCDFEEVSLIFRTAFNQEGRMTAILFRPGPPKFNYHTPGYADTNLIVEKPVVIITGKYRLNGMITMPKGKTNVPLLVLVHGSGPGDMDETAFKNKPFRDLALGLATKGIATLRYDKRTLTYGNDFFKRGTLFTVKEETIEDAVSAIKIAKNIIGVDSSKIYLLGHSLGGMLAPRIAKIGPPLAGLVLLAGPARPLEDLIREQNNYFLPVGTLTKEQKKSLASLQREVKMAKKVKPTSKLNADNTIFSFPISYWQDLNAYHQTNIAKSLSLPMFFLQGERDFQVTMIDFNLWRKALKTKPNVTFKSYEKLNHLFEEGEGRGTMEEYHVQSHIPEYVINDIVAWVGNKKK